MAYAKIRPRRGTKTEWELINPVLYEGEMGIVYPDTGIGTGLCKIKFGDGVSPWNNLEYAFDGEAAGAIYGGNATISHDIWLRSDSTDGWEATDPILGKGEITWDVTAEAFKIGDGKSHWTELSYTAYEFKLLEDYDMGCLDDNDTGNPDEKEFDFGDIADDVDPPEVVKSYKWQDVHSNKKEID